MILADKFIKALFPIALILLIPFPAFSQSHYQLTPGISVSEEYNDNIYLAPTDEVSEYITGLTPTIAFDILKEGTDFELSYAPTFAFYKNDKQNNIVRQFATLTWGQELSRYLRFDLSNTYTYSERPMEYFDTIVGVRRTRQPYKRNISALSFDILFGPRNTLTLGYGLNYLGNDDPTIDDGRIQTPNATLAYWFNVKNGIDLSYGYIKADFWNDVTLPADDYTGNTAGIGYTHRFTPHTSAFVRYDFTTRDFDGLTEDYDVHAPSAGIEHAFSPDASLLLGVGYFIRKSELSDDRDGYTYKADYTKEFERGSFTIGGAGGWWYYQDYIDPQNAGFTRYWSGNARVQYELGERFSFHLGGFYRLDRNDINREWEIWRGDAGISWSFLQYFVLSLDYRYAERDDDVDEEDYKNNRVFLTLTVSKLYRW